MITKSNHTHPARERKRNSDVFRQFLKMDGQKIVDVGCGGGALVRLMARNGASVTGVECNARQLDKARQSTSVADEQYVTGVGEKLPLPDQSFDAVVYFNSFHHVPSERMVDALNEAVRVLRPDGIIYICEPLAEGSNFELSKPLEDETVVREAAYQIIRNCLPDTVQQETSFIYASPVKYKNFEAYVEEQIRTDPRREPLLKTCKGQLMDNYERLGKSIEDGSKSYLQPYRVNILTKN